MGPEMWSAAVESGWPAEEGSAASSDPAAGAAVEDDPDEEKSTRVTLRVRFSLSLWESTEPVEDTFWTRLKLRWLVG
jgi:hypothetical protein